MFLIILLKTKNKFFIYLNIFIYINILFKKYIIKL